MWMYLRAVLSVDLHVVVAEVAGPDARRSLAAPQVDADGVLGPGQHGRALRVGVARVRLASMEHLDRVERDADARGVEALHAGLADGHGQAAPVGVAGEQRRLHQR